MLKTIGNTIIVFIVGLSILFFLTDGLNAFTSEGARRYEIEQRPIELPNIYLLDAKGNYFLIQDYSEKIVLVDFIFTKCRSVCPIITQNLKKLHTRLKRSLIAKHVVLLTISFDPDYDTPPVLARYSEAVGADTHDWIFATVENKRQLQILLDTFGIVVIPSPDGQFEHNAAIHLVDRSGRLAKIFDYDSIELILQDLMTRV